MSESMAFIGGVAVAGLAALVLLKGTGNPVQPGFTVPQQIQAPVVAPQVMPQQPQQFGYTGQPIVPNPLPNAPNNDQLRLDLERGKMQMDNLQRDNDRLKAENQQLQFQLQNFANAQQAQQAQNNQRAVQLQQPQSPWWSSGIVWAVGGMALTIGGGVVVAGVSALFSQKPRPVRTVQVIHPYNGPTPPLATTRRPEFLPPRGEARRVESHEYEDTY